MTDATVTEAGGGAQDSASRRLSRRYAAERRFRFYGILAVGLAIGALAILLVSVVSQGYRAFYIHWLTLDVPVPVERVDPRGTGERDVIRRANFNGLIQQSLRDEFPAVEGRRNLLDLFGLYSSVNAVRVLRAVVDDPSVIGGTIPVRMPISDDIDLYFKGALTGRETFEGRGEASPSDVIGSIEVSSTSNDFAEVLGELKARLASDADALEAEAISLELSAERAGDEAIAFARRQRAERARERAADYRERVAAVGSTEALTSETPSVLLEIHGGVVKVTELSSILVRGEVVIPLQSDAAAEGGSWRVVKLLTPEADRQVKDNQIAWAEALKARGRVEAGLNTPLFASADSREPEMAGVAGAFVGSLLTMMVTMLLAVPIGVATAIYLEEFAPKNRATDLIEVNINNLAAVPSIIFGLLGLAVFINTFGMPRSAPLVGGAVLALMTLPTVIISTRAALKAVPPSIRAGALGVGASPVQTVFHHVLPLALPGVMTGSIIGLAQALGETAPLLMIGMVAFVADVPTGLASPATVMPVQIYIWSDSAERAFESRTAAAIIILLAMMIVLNLIAVVLRRRFERRW